MSVIALDDTHHTPTEGFNMADVRMDYYRGSGAGGQHRNKVETCARAVHIPTGTVTVATESRSKEQNRKVALQRLRAIIEAHAQDAHAEAINGTRRDTLAEGRSWTWTGWRDEVKGPDGRRTQMSRALAGRLTPLL